MTMRVKRAPPGTKIFHTQIAFESLTRLPGKIFRYLFDIAWYPETGTLQLSLL